MASPSCCGPEYKWKSTFHFRAAIALIIGCVFVFFFSVLQTQTKQRTAKTNGCVSLLALGYLHFKRTAGIVDAGAPVVFEDVTDKTALAKFHHRSGSATKDYIFDTPSGGVAIFDYDSDGSAGHLSCERLHSRRSSGQRVVPHAALFRNLGNWKFEDVTEKGRSYK